MSSTTVRLVPCCFCSDADVGKTAEAQSVGFLAQATVQTKHGRCSGSGEGARTPSGLCRGTLEQGIKEGEKASAFHLH